MTENSAASTKPNRPSRRSIGHLSHYSKRKGMMGELIFVVKATSMGFVVSKPYSDSEPYDLVIEENRRLLRIQVKSVFTTSRWGYSVSVQRHSRGYGRPATQYSAEEIDFIAAYVVPHDAWYIIPVFEIISRAHIRLYPEGAKRNDGALFEKYREAWDLLRLGRARPAEAECETRSRMKRRNKKIKPKQKSKINKPGAPRLAFRDVGKRPPMPTSAKAFARYRPCGAKDVCQYPLYSSAKPGCEPGVPARGR